MLKFKYLIALVLPWLFLALPPAAQAKEMVSINKPEVNLRSGAGTQHEALWVLPKGFPLEVTGRSGNWLKVRDFENDDGWVYRPLVSKERYVIVKSPTANLRSGPGTSTRILGKASYGDPLRTLAHQNRWLKVETASGLTAWVARSLVWGW